MTNYLDEVNPENLTNVVKAIQNQLAALTQKEVVCNQLSEISDDLGDQRAGRFLALESGAEPTDADATGSFLSALGELFGDRFIRIGEVKDGQLMFGVGDGAGVFSGGDGIIDSEGIHLNVLNYILRMVAENDGVTRIGKLMMTLADGSGGKPVLALEFSEPAGSELLDNGGAEEGDFTGWTKGENGGVWEISDHAINGSYSFGFTYDSGGFPVDGTLTSDAISVTGGDKYTVSGKIGLSAAAEYAYEPYRKAEVKWYDASDVLLRTDQVFDLIDMIAAWRSFEKVSTAPADAVTAKVVFTVEHLYEAPEVYFDEFSFSETNTAHAIQLGDRGAFLDDQALVAAESRLIPAAWSGLSGTTVADGDMDELASYFYKVTFVDAFGETNPTSGAGYEEYLDVGKHGVNLTNIPTGRSTVTARKIYRTKSPDDGSFYLVATLNDNSTTTYSDRIGDDDLGTAAPLVNTTGTRPVLPTRASWFFDEVTTDVTVQRWHSTSMDYCFYYGPLAVNANDGDEYTLSAWLKAGTYSIYVFGVKHNSAGKADFYIDDVLVGSGQDWYSSSAVNNTTQTVTGVVVPTNGYHVLKIKVNGKSGLDYCLWLTKVWMKMAED